MNKAVIAAEAVKLGLFGYFVTGGSPTSIWPWEGSNYPSRSCNGPNGPKGPKFKQNKYKRDKIHSAFLAIFPRWFAHLNLALGGVQLPLPILQWFDRTERI